MFAEYAAISGLRLNLRKTVWIPLRLGDPAAARPEVLAHAPSWVGLRFAHCAKYLGFLLGPTRGEQGWTAACDKYLQRVRAWGRAGGGMWLSTIAYRVYAFSTLTFLAQLDEPPSGWPRRPWGHTCGAQACAQPRTMAMFACSIHMGSWIA